MMPAMAPGGKTGRENEAPAETVSSFLRARLKNTGMIAVFVLLFVLLSLAVPNFFSWVNMSGLALSVVTVGMIASTMLFALLRVILISPSVRS